MPSASGTSQLGGQLIIPYSTITKADFDIFFANSVSDRPVRVGWGWVLVRQNSVQTNKWVLWQGPILRPGIYELFPGDFGFSAFQYAVFVEWNVPNLSFAVTI